MFGLCSLKPYSVQPFIGIHVINTLKRTAAKYMCLYSTLHPEGIPKFCTVFKG